MNQPAFIIVYKFGWLNILTYPAVTLLYEFNLMTMNQRISNTAAYLKSLDTFQKGMIAQGYTMKFTAAGDGLMDSDNRIYNDAQVSVVSSMRFQGENSREEHAELYMIETIDGRKGFLSSTG